MGSSQFGWCAVFKVFLGFSKDTAIVKTLDTSMEVALVFLASTMRMQWLFCISTKIDLMLSLIVILCLVCETNWWKLFVELFSSDIMATRTYHLHWFLLLCNCHVALTASCLAHMIGPYRNQSVNLHCRSFDWILYGKYKGRPF